MAFDRPLAEVLSRNIVFVSGKGGVGKTVVSQAIASSHASRGKPTLWVTFEDPMRPAGEITQVAENLWHLNCEASRAFEEYIGLKLRVAKLAQIFLKNKVMQYLSKAAPGLHELILLGKVWHERQNFDHVVVDMPSTGYGLAMFQSVYNFRKLFRGGGPIYKDADAMLGTFGDRETCGQLIVALPEEMPLREALELGSFLRELFPANPPAFLVNKRFPTESLDNGRETPDDWKSPVPASVEDYIRKRGLLESHNLRIWRDEGIRFDEIEYVPAPATDTADAYVREVSSWLMARRLA